MLPPSRRAVLFAAIAPLAVVPSCVTERAVRRSPHPSVQGEVLARYRIEWEGAPVGYLTELRFPFPSGAQRYFRVEDTRRQDVGFVTENGLAYRFRPHPAEPDHVATDTMARNLQQMFALPGPPAIVPVPPAGN